MFQITVARLQGMVGELNAMMTEGNGQASIAFALKVDSVIVQLQPLVESSNKSRQRIGLRHCDKTRSGQPILGTQDSLKFSTLEQRDAMDPEMKELNDSKLEAPIDVTFTRDELESNGIATNLGRLIALGPLLAHDEAAPQ